MTGRTRRCTLVAAVAFAIATPVAALATTSGSAPSPSSSYSIRSGDTLTTIAAQMHLSGGWQQLYEANRRTVGTDPNRLVVGTVLVRPGSAAAPAAPSAQPALSGAAARPANETAPSFTDDARASTRSRQDSVLAYALAAGAAVLAMLFAFLWWRSRRSALDTKRDSWYVAPPVLLGQPQELEMIDLASPDEPHAPRFGVSQADLILHALHEGRR